jgi:hypothetical protein
MAFGIVFCLLIIINILWSIVIFYKFLSLQDELYSTKVNLIRSITDETERVHALTRKIDSLTTNLDRHFLHLRETLMPTIPTKANNWDSVRDAFRKPSKKDLEQN